MLPFDTCRGGRVLARSCNDSNTNIYPIHAVATVEYGGAKINTIAFGFMIEVGVPVVATGTAVQQYVRSMC